MQQKGFSLVELAIVLVIIGLITGGILTGQDLIRASELNSVISDVNKYKTAVNTFKLKYNGLPGDLNNAASYWSTTVSGNGDGIIVWGNENFRAWQQLNFSGIVPGSFTGTAGPGALIGTNIPASKLAPAGFGLYNMDSGGGASTAQPIRFLFGAAVAADTNYAAVITPQDAASIDTKMDDGLPQNGAVFSNTGSSPSGTCYSGTAYSLTNTGVACTSSFKYQ